MKARLLALLIAVSASASVTATELPPLPKPVSSMGAVECDGFLYVYGGHSGKTHSYDNKTTLGTFQRLNLKAPKQWEALPGGPILQGVNLAAYEGKVYRVGGMTPRNNPGDRADMISETSVAVYDPKAGRWEALADLPAGRSSHDVAVIGKRLYVVGGWNSLGGDNKPTWHDTLLTLDLSKPGAKWETMPQPFQRRALTVSVVGEKLFVVGGLLADANADRTVNVLDTASGQWSEAPKLPGKTSRVGFSPAAATVNGKLIVSTLDAMVYRLSDDGKAWEIVGQSQQRRMVHRLIPFGTNQVILVGGTSGGEAVATLEVIKLADKGQPVQNGN